MTFLDFLKKIERIFVPSFIMYMSRLCKIDTADVKEILFAYANEFKFDTFLSICKTYYVSI